MNDVRPRLCSSLPNFSCDSLAPLCLGDSIVPLLLTLCGFNETLRDGLLAFKRPVARRSAAPFAIW
jgi:hypothetical protein